MTTPSGILAAYRKARTDESAAYAAARQELLADEIELQRRIDALAAKRRLLPPGPVIGADYRFIDTNGANVGLSDLFGRKTTLMTYFWMYGPDRARPCPCLLYTSPSPRDS